MKIQTETYRLRDHLKSVAMGHGKRKRLRAAVKRRVEDDNVLEVISFRMDRLNSRRIPAEERMVRLIGSSGVYFGDDWTFTRNWPLLGGRYFGDFVCRSRKVVIEINEEYHLDPDQMAKDTSRLRDLEVAGYSVLTLWTTETDEQWLRRTYQFLKAMDQKVAAIREKRAAKKNREPKLQTKPRVGATLLPLNHLQSKKERATLKIESYDAYLKRVGQQIVDAERKKSASVQKILEGSRGLTRPKGKSPLESRCELRHQRKAASTILRKKAST